MVSFPLIFCYSSFFYPSCILNCIQTARTFPVFVLLYLTRRITHLVPLPRKDCSYLHESLISWREKKHNINGSANNSQLNFFKHFICLALLSKMSTLSQRQFLIYATIATRPLTPNLIIHTIIIMLSEKEMLHTMLCNDFCFVLVVRNLILINA